LETRKVKTYSVSMRGIAIAGIAVFAVAVICVVMLACWSTADLGCDGRTHGAIGAVATNTTSTCPNQAAKQAWLTAQAGVGTIQSGSAAPPAVAWEGDSGKPGIPPTADQGCVLLGATGKDGRVLPGQGQLLPYGTVWTDASGLQDLCQIGGVTGPCVRGIAGIDPTPLQSAPTALKGLTRSKKPPRTALYHGGIIGNAALDLGCFKRYMAQVIRFVQARGINRMFIVLTPWDVRTTPFYSDPQNIVDAVIVPLYLAWVAKPTNWIDSERPTVGVVPYLRPKDGLYNVRAPGGGDPTPPIVGGLCAVCTDAAQCAGRQIATTQLGTGDTQDCPSQAYQPLRPAGGPIDPAACSLPCTFKAGDSCVGCDSPATCGNPSGCPANPDQVMLWIQQVNTLVRASPLIAAADREFFVISNLITDGEDSGVYQNDWGMVQLAQMAARRGPAGASGTGAAVADVRNIGFAKGLQATPTDVLKNIQASSQILGPSAPPDSAAARAAGFPGGFGQWTYAPEEYWFALDLFPCSGNAYQLAQSSAGDATAPNLSSTTESTICTLNTSYRAFARTFQSRTTKVPASSATVDPDTTTLAWMYMRYLEAASTGTYPTPSGPQTSENQQYHGVAPPNDLGAWQEASRGLQQLAANIRTQGETTNIIPLLSFENLSATRAPNGTGGAPGDPTRDCLALNYFGQGEPKPDLCGTFDGFSYFSWDDFAQFFWLFSDYVRFADFSKTVGGTLPPPATDTDVRGWVGLYEVQFIPAAWMPDGKFSLPDGTPDDADRWDEYWRFSPACNPAQFPCGADPTDRDAECKRYAADPAIIAKLQASCPAGDPTHTFDAAAFAGCRYDASKPPGTVFYCTVEDKFKCTTDSQCNGHGTCDLTSGACVCTPPWLAPDCATHTGDCHVFPEDACLNNGTCSPDPKDASKPWTCVCANAPGSTPFYTGDRCEIPYDPIKNACYGRCSAPGAPCGMYCTAAMDDPDSYCETKSSDLSQHCHDKKGGAPVSCCKACKSAADCPSQSKGTGRAVCTADGFCDYQVGPPAECTSDQQCPSLNAPQCDASGACVGCDSDAACVGRGSNTKCSQGKCGPGAPPPPPSKCVGGCPLAAAPQCTAAGICGPCSGAAGAAACAQRTDGLTSCGAGGSCVAPSPPPPTSKCTCDSDCQTDTAPQCTAGKCSACTSDAACSPAHGPRTSCVAGKCTAPGACAGRCVSEPAACDAYCAALNPGSYCQGTLCHGTTFECCQACAADTDCPAGAACQSGMCVAKGAPPEGCACDGGACDPYCAAISPGSYCQGLVCHGTSEPCCQLCGGAGGGACPAGTTCVSGKCQPAAAVGAAARAVSYEPAPDEQPFEY